MPVLLLQETTKTVHPRAELEHVLAASASGRRYCVLEVLSQGPGQLEAFEVSGWLGAMAAQRRLDELAELWLSEASRERMRAGEYLRLEELRWTT